MERLDAGPIAALNVDEAGVDLAELSVKTGAIGHHALSNPVPAGPGPASVSRSNSLYCSRRIGVNQNAECRNLIAGDPWILAWTVGPSFRRSEDLVWLISESSRGAPLTMGGERRGR